MAEMGLEGLNLENQAFKAKRMSFWLFWVQNGVILMHHRLFLF